MSGEKIYQFDKKKKKSLSGWNWIDDMWSLEGAQNTQTTTALKILGKL